MSSAEHIPQATAIERLLLAIAEHPLADRLLMPLLRRPRLLQCAALLLGLSLAWLTLSSAPQPASADQPAVGVPVPSSPQLDALLALLAAYNQASIAAGTSGNSDLLLPFLDPTGSAWAATTAEYQRREMAGERHSATLLRWGLLRSEIAGSTALIETQEQWSDVTLRGAEVIDAQEDVLSRSIYQLRQHMDGRWTIVAITSTLVLR